MFKNVLKNRWLAKINKEETRHMIIHYHIYKNAGSTVFSILMNNFGSDKCGNFEDKYFWGTLSPDDILKHTLDNPELKAISSHHARLPVPRHQHIVFHPIIFLRHPIDRIRSIYTYEKKRPFDATHPGIKIAHEKDFTGYIKHRLSDGSAPIRNFQTVHLSGRHKDWRNATATNNDLKIALARLSELPFFGIVELFDESLKKLSHYLAPYIPLHDINYRPANVSIGRQDTIEERLNYMENILGHDLYQELLDKNALDIQLYSEAQKLFLLNDNK